MSLEKYVEFDESKTMTCKSEGCTKEAYKDGYCDGHYNMLISIAKMRYDIGISSDRTINITKGQ